MPSVAAQFWLSPSWVAYWQAIHQPIFLVGPLAPLYLGAICGSTVLALSIMGSVFTGHSSADLWGRTPVSPVPGSLLWQHHSTILILCIMGSVFHAIQQLIFVVEPLSPLYLGAFCGSTVHALSIMGCVFAGQSSANLLS